MAVVCHLSAFLPSIGLSYWIYVSALNDFRTPTVEVTFTIKWIFNLVVRILLTAKMQAKTQIEDNAIHTGGKSFSVAL